MAKLKHIAVACNRCSHWQTAPEEYAGRTVKCANCGGPIEVIKCSPELPVLRKQQPAVAAAAIPFQKPISREAATICAVALGAFLLGALAAMTMITTKATGEIPIGIHAKFDFMTRILASEADDEQDAMLIALLETREKWRQRSAALQQLLREWRMKSAAKR